MVIMLIYGSYSQIFVVIVTTGALHRGPISCREGYAGPCLEILNDSLPELRSSTCMTSLFLCLQKPTAK